MRNYLLAINTSSQIGNPALGKLGNLSGTDFFARLLPAGFGLAFVIGALIFFFMLVWGAISWITSGGDKQALEGARGRITSALIGILLLFASYAIIKLIEKFFGISILNLKLGELAL